MIGFSKPLNPEITINSTIGYAFQDLKSELRQTSDLIILKSAFLFKENNFLNYSTGIYIENFDINYQSSFYYTLNQEQNKGYRYGPEFQIRYLKQVLLNIEYRFLMHDSDFTSYPSYEHWIRMMFIETITKKLSAILFVDYFDRHFQSKTESFALYSNISAENQLYLKISYDLNKMTEFYTKYGYFRENLFFDDPKL